MTLTNVIFRKRRDQSRYGISAVFLVPVSCVFFFFLVVSEWYNTRTPTYTSYRFRSRSIVSRCEDCSEVSDVSNDVCKVEMSLDSALRTSLLLLLLFLVVVVVDSRLSTEVGTRRDEIVERKDSISANRASKRSWRSLLDWSCDLNDVSDVEFFVVVFFSDSSRGLRIEDSYLASLVTRRFFSGEEVLECPYFILKSSHNSALFWNFSTNALGSVSSFSASRASVFFSVCVCVCVFDALYISPIWYTLQWAPHTLHKKIRVMRENVLFFRYWRRRRRRANVPLAASSNV